MSSNQAIYQHEIAHDAVFFRKLPIALTRGEGAVVWDAEGQEYIDCTSSYGVMGVGYSNPLVQQHISQQLQKMTTCHHLFANDTRAEYLDALMAHAPATMDKAYLCNSGTEAVEAAIKVAVAITGRTKIVACSGAYHGLTLGATGLAAIEGLREPFSDILNQAEFVTRNDIASLEATIDDNTALFITELVQANDGGSVLDPEFVHAARRLTQQHGTLMVIDEVCTGFCRTGEWFASTSYDVVPDAVTLAKSFGGGLPMGALLMNKAIAEDFPKRLHSNTFGGNPLVMAAGLGAIRFAEQQQLCQRVQQAGERLAKQLRAIKPVRTVKGKGLLLGLEFDADIEQVREHLQKEHHILVIPRGTGLLLMPPLVISDQQIDWVSEAIAATLNTLTG